MRFLSLLLLALSILTVAVATEAPYVLSGISTDNDLPGCSNAIWRLHRRDAIFDGHDCGGNMGPCDANGCEGINRLDGPGVCTAGQYKGCECVSLCSSNTPKGPCDENDCAGLNAGDGGLGVCTGGKFRGCQCSSLCSNDSPHGPCNENDCDGINSADGCGLGVCTGGKYQGCSCASICSSNHGPCNQNGCAGVVAVGAALGTCTGTYKGCLCTP